MSEYKTCKGCGAQYKGDACPYHTEIIVQKGDIPTGILVLNNITTRQWNEAMDAWKNRKDGDVIVVFGMDPSIEAKITYFEMPGSCTCQK